MNATVSMPISTAKKSSKTTKEVSTTFKNIVLEGVETLRAQKVKTTFVITRKLHPATNKPTMIVSKKQIAEEVEPLIFPLTEVTSEELDNYRKHKISSFVLKVDGKLYYTAIPEELSFVSSNILGVHQCAVTGNSCNRLSPASDEEGGCEKVRNFSNYIERYPWITTGYETFHTNHDSFVVVNCLHFEKCPPRKPHSISKN